MSHLKKSFSSSLVIYLEDDNTFSISFMSAWTKRRFKIRTDISSKRLIAAERDKAKEEEKHHYLLAEADGRISKQLEDILEEYRSYVNFRQKKIGTSFSSAYLLTLFMTGWCNTRSFSEWHVHTDLFARWLAEDARNLRTGKEYSWQSCRTLISQANQFTDWLELKEYTDKKIHIPNPSKAPAIKIDESNLPTEVKTTLSLSRGKVRIRYLSFKTGQYESLSLDRHPEFKTKEAAKKWIQENREHLFIGELEALETEEWRSNVAMVKILKSYIDYRTDHVSAWKTCEWTLEKHILPAFNKGGYKLTNFKAFVQEFEGSIQGLQNQKGELLSKSSQDKVINTLNQFQKWLKKERFIDEVVRIEAPKLTKKQKQEKVKNAIYRYIDDDKFEIIATYLEKIFGEEYEQMARIQRHGCLRRGELAGLSIMEMRAEVKERSLATLLKKEGLHAYGCLALTGHPMEPTSVRYGVPHERKPLKFRETIGGDKGTEYVPILDKHIARILAHRIRVVQKKEKKRQQDQAGQRISTGDEQFMLLFTVPIAKYTSAFHLAAKQIGLNLTSHALRHTGITNLYIQFGPEVSKRIARHKSDSVHEQYLHTALAVGAKNTYDILDSFTENFEPLDEDEDEEESEKEWF